MSMQFTNIWGKRYGDKDFWAGIQVWTVAGFDCDRTYRVGAFHCPLSRAVNLPSCAEKTICLKMSWILKTSWGQSVREIKLFGSGKIYSQLFGDFCECLRIPKVHLIQVIAGKSLVDFPLFGVRLVIVIEVDL